MSLIQVICFWNISSFGSVACCSTAFPRSSAASWHYVYGIVPSDLLLIGGSSCAAGAIGLAVSFKFCYVPLSSFSNRLEKRLPSILNSYAPIRHESDS